jgi:RND family efflux transporter MFP subunit
MKKVTYIIVGIVAIALIAFILTNNKKKNEAETAIVSAKSASVAVRVDTVAMENISAGFIANGNFEPSQKLQFSAENSGRVKRVLVEEGSNVKIGQVLAVIEGDKLSVDMQSANVAYQTALADSERYQNAFATGGVTRQQLDQSKLALANAKARLDQARINYGDATIRSSINGVVNKKLIEPGSVVNSGTPLFELVNVSKLKLRVTVSEQQVSELKVGSVVPVKASVFPDKEFSGKVSFIAPLADASLNFPVDIEITNPGNEIKAGMYGTASFGANDSQKKSLLVIPRTAFVGSVNSNQVFVVQNEVANLKKIVAGRVFGDKVEVLSGLQEGEIVVTSGQINLSDGTKISVLK